MADISITQRHTMPLEEARRAAQNVADELAKEFAISSRWEQDILSFERTGVSGTLALRSAEAHLEIELGSMLKGFSSMIEEKLTRKMRGAFTV